MQQPPDDEPTPFPADDFSAKPSQSENPLEEQMGSQTNPYLVNWPAANSTGSVQGESVFADPLVSGDDRVTPETVTEESVHQLVAKPRVWTTLLVFIASVASFMACSLVMLVVAVFVVHGEFNPRLIADAEAMRAVSASRIGFLLLLVTPQLALLAPCLVAAFFSPVPIRKRLSMVRGHWPIWAWFAAAFATPLIGWMSSVIMGSLMEESENLKMMSDIFRGHGEGGFLIPLALLIGATPALCEELVFRGYIQTRLNRRFGPAVGIGLASAAFAAVHMDLIHVIAVFPLGVYLGVISWRSGSLFPAMLGHFVNNSISVFAVVLGPETMDETPTVEMALFLLCILGLGLVGAVLTGIAMWRWPVPSQAAAIPAQSAA